MPSDLSHIGNPDFLRHLEEMRQTHVNKAAGYSGQDNPDTWTNFREAEAWGSTPLQGCLIRMGDKYRRVQNLRRNPDNDRVGESVKDTLMDLANYAIIGVCLLEEEEKAKIPAGVVHLCALIYPHEPHHASGGASGEFDCPGVLGK